MKRSELVHKISKKMDDRLETTIVERGVEVIFDEIVAALAEGRRVELRGFGSFATKERAPRLGCDPRTGDEIKVERRFIPNFRAGKSLFEAINTGGR